MSVVDTLDTSAVEEGWLLRTGDREPWLRGYLGNGFLTAQLTAEGGLLGDVGVPLHLMAGLYDRAAGEEVERPVRLPSWQTITLSVAGTTLRPALAHSYTQTLDTRRGRAETTHAWTVDGTDVRVTTLQTVMRHEPNLAMIRLSLEAERACELMVEVSLDTAGPLAQSVTQGYRDLGSIWAEARTVERDIGVAVAAVLFSGDRDGQAAGQGLVLRIAVRPGDPAVVHWLVAVHSERTAPNPRLAALADLDRARSLGPERLWADHEAAWAALWQADIVVEGDDQVQRFVRAGLFALRCSLRAGVNASIAPMGLSSLGYNGHIFWDADTWMYPPLLLLHPDLARGIVAYRRERLPAARARARAEGYDGAMFPWESATDGTETTPLSIARTGLKEHHITACVALAQWQYFLATGDRAWLAEHGWPVLEAAAAFWVSRVTATADGYAILDVICADEYAEDVDNNAFTNAAARAALLAATEAALELGLTPSPRWAAVAGALILRREGDLVLEFDGYDGRTIKQADVELLTYPLEYPLADTAIACNLDTYRRATDPDAPAMSRSISAIVAAQLGRREEALSLFLACYQPHLYGPFYTLAETRTNGEVNFLTGIGGALQALLFGFAGLRLHKRALAVDPLLPVGWQALRFPTLRWRDATLSLAVLEGDQLELTIHGGEHACGLLLRRWRPGAVPLRVDAVAENAASCSLAVEGWHVETLPGNRSWHAWPPAGGPDTSFVMLRLSVDERSGPTTTVVLEVEQRVLNAD